MEAIDLRLDVSEAAGLGEPAEIAATVILPDPASLPERPLVCFAKPGGGYNRRYFTLDLPGPATGAQAAWHAERGWIFVALDHLGSGDSSHHDGARLDYAVIARTHALAERQILDRLARGFSQGDFPAIADPIRIGIGQSMGGNLTIAQQGLHHGYHGVAILGFSAIHSRPPTPPGAGPFAAPWLARDTLLDMPGLVLNAEAIKAMAGSIPSPREIAWCFHHDDIDPALVDLDLERLEHGYDAGGLDIRRPPPSWASLTYPDAVALSSLTPGIVATEAAAIRCPVLCAMGERDIVPDPHREPSAYPSAASIDLFVCPRMGHMHNFAGTRALLWRRIELWAEWVKARNDSH